MTESSFVVTSVVEYGCMLHYLLMSFVVCYVYLLYFSILMFCFVWSVTMFYFEFFFFFKQKTAYKMRISDWSSDVCSSDLVDVRHKAHVGLVDAHAEGNRRHHDQPILAQEARWIAGARFRAEARVIRQRGNTLPAQEISRLLDPGARQAVDNAAIARMVCVNDAQPLTPHFVFFDEAVTDVRTIEACTKLAGRHPFKRKHELAACRG